MAKYTVELNDIVKSGYNIFDFDYEFYDNEQKPTFENYFIEHFRFYEIGVETVARFKHNLKVKFNETLPYYNMLLKTSLYEYDLKNNYNLTETFTKQNNKSVTGNANNTISSLSDTIQDVTETGNRNTDVENETNTIDNSTIDKTSNNLANNKNVESDTPNALLSMNDIKNNLYASKANIQDNNLEITEHQETNINTNTKGTSKGAEETENITQNKTKVTGDIYNDTETETQEQNTETYTLERVGDIGVDTTPDKLLKHIEVQKILTTVYKQFFIECEDLFMQIF